MTLTDNDFWAGDEDEEHGNEQTEELDREWQARKQEFWNSGYREGYASGSVAGYEWGVLRGAALTLQAASAKDLGTEQATAASALLNNLAPGQVQNEVCKQLIQKLRDNSGSAAEPIETLANNSSKTSLVQQQAVAAISEAGFRISTERKFTEYKT